MVDEREHDPATVDFQGKHAEETFQFYFRQHWIRLVWPFCRMVFYTLLLFLVGYVVFVRVGLEDTGTRRATLLVFCFLLLVAHVEFLVRFYRHFLYVVIVTDKKVHRIKKTLLAIDEHQSMDLWMLQDINKIQHGIIQNFLGFGSLSMEAQDTALRIHFVPRITEQYEVLSGLRERARSRMGYIGGMVQRGANGL